MDSRTQTHINTDRRTYTTHDHTRTAWLLNTSGESIKFGCCISTNHRSQFLACYCECIRTFLLSKFVCQSVCWFFCLSVRQTRAMWYK